MAKNHDQTLVALVDRTNSELIKKTRPNREEEAWLVLADYLEEKGDYRSELIRLTHRLYHIARYDKSYIDRPINHLTTSDTQILPPEFFEYERLCHRRKELTEYCIRNMQEKYDIALRPGDLDMGFIRTIPLPLDDIMSIKRQINTPKNPDFALLWSFYVLGEVPFDEYSRGSYLTEVCKYNYDRMFKLEFNLTPGAKNWDIGRFEGCYYTLQHSENTRLAEGMAQLFEIARNHQSNWRSNSVMTA